jgi:hypothetical protein
MAQSGSYGAEARPGAIYKWRHLAMCSTIYLTTSSIMNRSAPKYKDSELDILRQIARKNPDGIHWRQIVQEYNKLVPSKRARTLSGLRSICHSQKIEFCTPARARKKRMGCIMDFKNKGRETGDTSKRAPCPSQALNSTTSGTPGRHQECAHVATASPNHLDGNIHSSVGTFANLGRSVINGFASNLTSSVLGISTQNSFSKTIWMGAPGLTLPTFHNQKRLLSRRTVRCRFSQARAIN